VFFVPSRQSLQKDSPRGVVLHRDNETGREKVTQGFQPGAPISRVLCEKWPNHTIAAHKIHRPM